MKYHNSSPKVIQRVLKCIISYDVRLYYLLYEKNEVKKDLTSLSCELTGKLISKISEDTREVPSVCIDRYLHGKNQEIFNRQLIDMTGISQIRHEDSKSVHGIQIADFVAGTLNKYYNQPHDEYAIEYYRIISNKLIKTE